MVTKAVKKAIRRESEKPEPRIAGAAPPEVKPPPRTAVKPGRFTDMAVRNMKTPGYFSDGGNLWLRITPSGSKSWAFIYTRDKKTRELGLGSLATVRLGSLDDATEATARGAARAARMLLRSGIDPIEARRAALNANRADDARRAFDNVTLFAFKVVAAECIKAMTPAWSNPKSAAQWSASLENYAYPVFGDVHVRDVSKEHVLKALRPIWSAVPETASRVRGRIEKVLSYAHQAGYRPEALNPARWKGGLDNLLSAPAKTKTVEHFAALAIDDMPTFVKELREREGLSARALEFTILCAVRTSETIGATWSEVDLTAKTWTIPKERMKAKKEHKVPLSARAVEILRNMGHREGHLFPGAKDKKPLSNMAMAELLKGMRPGFTVHGMRSTFRDWASERTNFPHEVCEMALAHAISNQAEAAYRRGDLFVKRTKLMEQWAGFCAKAWLNGGTNAVFAVVPLAAARKAKAAA